MGTETGSSSGVLIAGTSSEAGKSLVVTGLCRALARRGIAVAPFKAQNMSNNSCVCSDGAEIGRAQYLQAQAAGVVPESAMNPVLLKPGSDHRSHIVLRGRPCGALESGEYANARGHLAAAAFAAYDDLAGRFDVIICEGAGSPAEINLRAGDYVNLGLARAKGLPVVVVGDIDRGGVLASLYGTVALLDAKDRQLITAFLINKFRGDVGVLQPGLEELSRRTGIPFVGVLPWLPNVWLDAEDSLAVGSWQRQQGVVDVALRVAVVHLPRMSNATDVDALAAEPGVEVVVTADPGVIAGADLAVLPGSRATVSDLEWLRRCGLAEAIETRAGRGAPVLGICGGYQMLAQVIDDPVESARGMVEGLRLLPVKISFGADKVLSRPVGTWCGHEVEAYEIHHGIAEIDGEAEPFLDGCRQGQVWGTMWHGALENDDFRRAWLADIAAIAGSDWHPDPGAPEYGALRETMINTLADAMEQHVDLGLLLAGTRVAGRL
ncbi:MAG TPA: cobyric acid synthase [Propionibacteriaceae bacterium]|nr:cobyric acid synthase [Propionibacteriaceae bacterium]